MSGHSLLYLSDPIVLHLNHMEGVVGPASFLVKLNVARQPFKTDLKYININEDSKLVIFSCSGDSAAVRQEGKKGDECSLYFQFHAGETAHLPETVISLRLTVYSMPGPGHSHPLN